jgi:hypothetical protein
LQYKRSPLREAIWVAENRQHRNQGPAIFETSSSKSATDMHVRWNKARPEILSSGSRDFAFASLRLRTKFSGVFVS